MPWLSADAQWLVGTGFTITVTIVGSFRYLIRNAVRDVGNNLDDHIMASTGEARQIESRVGELEGASRALEARVDGVERDQRSVLGRLDRIQDQIAAAPTAADVHQIALALTQVKGAIAEIEARLTGRISATDSLISRVDAMVTRQENYLLRRSESA